MLTIAVSLFVWGAFLLVELNLGQAMDRWRSEARIIVYLEPATSAPLQHQVENWVSKAAWVDSVSVVSSAEARRRFREAFPSLADITQGWTESPLPPSLEIALRPEGEFGRVDADALQSWLSELAARPGVASVDDDRDWIVRLEGIAATGRTIALAVGVILLGAATLTTASVIRLAAMMYQDEISIMRIVGATEFLIRGPFYSEGLLQGGLGGVLASLALYVGYLGLANGSAADGLLGELLLSRFLSPLQLGFLVAVGCLSGGLGAVISLRGEVLRRRRG